VDSLGRAQVPRHRPLRVVQILQCLSRGGASRATLHAARESRRRGPFEHHIVSLTAPDRTAMDWARDAGISVSSRSDDKALAQTLAEADIVQVNFWNSPELYDFARRPWPAMRLLLWVHVVGDATPHVLTPQWVDFADLVVAGCPRTTQLPVLTAPSTSETPTAMVWPGADFRRLAGLRSKRTETFRVGYIGAVDHAKIHPRFVELHNRARIQPARFIVCGVGDARAPMQAEAASSPGGDRFDWRGYVEDIAGVLETLDVFGYPLCAGTYASAEVVLQEAMFAGVPPVLFPRGGIGDVVQHRETGLVVENDEDYVAALEFLARHPEERDRLGANARDHARRHFGAERTAEGLNAAYEQLAQRPKRERAWPSAPTASAHSPGATLFLESLGGFADAFEAALSGRSGEQIRAGERAIRKAPAVVTTPSGGGLLHYRSAFRDDPHLRLWAGLVLLEAGRPALALGEFAAADRLGLPPERTAAYRDEATQVLRTSRGEPG